MLKNKTVLITGGTGFLEEDLVKKRRTINSVGEGNHQHFFRKNRKQVISPVESKATKTIS